MKSNIGPEEPERQPNFDHHDWLAKAWKKLIKSKPPEVEVILLAHADETLAMKATPCPHGVDDMLEAAMDLNDGMLDEHALFCGAGNPERN